MSKPVKKEEKEADETARWGRKREAKVGGRGPEPVKKTEEPRDGVGGRVDEPGQGGGKN